MAISADIQNIKHANAATVYGEQHTFDIVRIATDGGSVTLYFAQGKGQAVADAINAAVKS